jgi:hypothetical protein
MILKGWFKKQISDCSLYAALVSTYNCVRHMTLFLDRKCLGRNILSAFNITVPGPLRILRECKLSCYPGNTAKNNSDAILIKLEELASSEFIKEAYGI